MAGQDAVNAARAFGDALDADRRRADQDRWRRTRRRALSVRQITGQPILFMGTGEKTEALEVVPGRARGLAHPRHGRRAGAGREGHAATVDREQAEKLARKLKKGKDFDLEDLHDQLRQVEKMGGLGALMDKLPAQLAGKAARRRRRATRRRSGARSPIIRSMTPGERRYPEEHRRLPQAPDRGRLRRPGLRGQPAAQELPADAEDDEDACRKGGGLRCGLMAGAAGGRALPAG